MKNAIFYNKLWVCLLLCMSFAFAHAQQEEIIYFTGFEAAEGFVASQTYDNVTIRYSGTEDRQWGTFHGTPSSTSPIFGSQSMQMRWYTSNRIGYTQTEFDLNNVSRVLFSAKNTNTINVTVSYSSDGGNQFGNDSTYTLTTSAQRFQYTISPTGEHENVRLRFQVSYETAPTNTSRLIIDSVVVYGITGLEPTMVATPAFNPESGDYFETQTVAISTTTEDAVIRYTTDGTEPDETSTTYTEPLTIATNTILKAKAWKEGLNPSLTATAQYVFPIEVPDIAAFKAANQATNTTLYKITGDVTFVYRNGSNMYVRDASGGLLIYDNTPVITTQYQEGDIISGGVIGRYTLYAGLSELIPARNTAVSVSNAGAITPATVTVQDIITNYSQYESQLVKLDDVTFGSGQFTNTSPTSIAFSQSGDTIAAYNGFRTLEMSIEAGSRGDITGFVLRYNTNFQVTPRSNDDIELEIIPVPDPVLTLVSPEDNGDYSTEEGFSIGLNLENFTLGTDGLIKIEGDFLSGDIYIDSEEELTLVMDSVFNPAAGNYFIKVSLTALDSSAWNPAVETIHSFSISAPVVAAPEFSVDGGTYHNPLAVIITTATEGAMIFYTTDGTTPADTTLLYTEAVEINQTTTLKAIAYKEGWTPSDVTEAQYTISYNPSLAVDPVHLDFTDVDSVKTITIEAFHLNAPITVTTDNNAFSITPDTLPDTTTVAFVRIAFRGDSDTTGIITITSDTLQKTVTLAATIEPVVLPEEIIYSTGFEAAEDFEASQTYNNTTIRYSGPEDRQWGTFHGTPSTTAFIFGAQSMQMRWYDDNPQYVGYTFTHFDLPNVSKVMFQAKNTNNLNVTVSFSTDGGTTYQGDSTFTLHSSHARYQFNVSETGQYDNVRLRFMVSVPATPPTSTSRLIIDSVVVYGITGIEPSTVAAPTFTPVPGNYFDPQTVTISSTTEDAVIRYTTDGTDPDENSTLYTEPVTIAATTTLKAKAWKTGLTPSFITIGNYSFPVEVENIAAFKAASSATNTTVYKITGDVTFVYRNGRNIFIQDTTGGLLIYDNANSVITTEYEEGDIISGGIWGTYTLYNGLTEMIPVRNTSESAQNTGEVIPDTVTITMLLNRYDEYESKLVTIDYAIFKGGTFNTTDAATLKIYDETDSMDCRNSFRTLHMTIEEGQYAYVTGFTSKFNTATQIAPRNNDDISLWGEVEEPAFDPAGGSYSAAQNVTITSATSGAVIYYSISPDTSANTLYTGPITISQSATLYARAEAEGMMPSAKVNAAYIITTGIDEMEQLDIPLYPNPATEFVTLNLSAVDARKVEILTSSGQMVFSTENPGYEMNIYVKEYKKGLYLVRVHTSKGIIVKKLMKM